MLTINSNRSLYTHYLRGKGIEIGALNSPLIILHDNAKVKCVVYRTRDDLRRRYPDLHNFVDVDILSSAEELEGIEDDSLDFIIANHVIEHLANFIKTLATWHKKLRNRGILFLAFPDARGCPDKVRRITSLSHYLKDFLLNVEEANDEHLLAFVFAWNPNYFNDPDEIDRVLKYMWEKGLWYLDQEAENMLTSNRDRVVNLLEDRKVEAHQHTFDYQSMKDLFQHIYQNFDFKYRLIDLSMTKHLLNEHIFILKKVQECQSTFMDECATVSEEKEYFMETFVKEMAALIQEQGGVVGKQRNILDQRFEMIEELRGLLNERFETIEEQHTILDHRFEMIRELTKAVNHEN